MPIPLLALLAALGLALPAGVTAQGWPVRPVRFVIPFPPGSGPDVAMRMISERLAGRWGQPVVVDNRPGASGMIGMRSVIQGAADDHTFLFAQGSAIAVVPRTVKGADVDYARDLAPVALVAVAPMVVAVRGDDEWRSLGDLLAAARARPDRIDVANAGRATIPHLGTEVLGLNAGVRFFPVPFQGSAPAAASVVGGQTRAIVDGYSVLYGLIAAGKLRVLAVMADRVYPGLEAFPLTTDMVRETAVMGWFGVYANKRTSPLTVLRVNADLNAVLARADVVARLRDLGTYVRTGTPQALDAFTLAELRYWAEMLRALKLGPE